jgi:hypothetical protein
MFCYWIGGYINLVAGYNDEGDVLLKKRNRRMDGGT